MGRLPRRRNRSIQRQPAQLPPLPGLRDAECAPYVDQSPVLASFGYQGRFATDRPSCTIRIMKRLRRFEIYYVFLKTDARSDICQAPMIDGALVRRARAASALRLRDRSARALPDPLPQVDFGVSRLVRATSPTRSGIDGDRPLTGSGFGQSRMTAGPSGKRVRRCGC